MSICTGNNVLVIIYLVYKYKKRQKSVNSLERRFINQHTTCMVFTNEIVFIYYADFLQKSTSIDMEPGVGKSQVSGTSWSSRYPV